MRGLIANVKTIVLPALIACKRLTRNSSQFEDAWVKNQLIRNGNLKIFADNLETGETEQVYLYRFTNMRIVSVRDWLPNKFDASTANQPPLQEISFIYETIEWQALPDGIVAQDSVTQR